MQERLNSFLDERIGSLIKYYNLDSIVGIERIDNISLTVALIDLKQKLNNEEL